ncbi:MAG: bifunctional phosphoribosyl-AMP cyclohydrolase/phosphoribosyl-ATP diphosphatase HisIE [Clostridia bacterium]|nr:bifunctional phosphoribosyl-AMP cyclohydrolase/phosphoribosyl-ATP diphosphatase HisIE [Clostridia bacterium]
MFDNLKFNADGLIPAIAQDADTGEVLMMAWMNRESLALTVEKGEAVYYSRSRACLWHKGETSGNTQKVVGMYADCDGDTLLLKIKPNGPACHTGEVSCFYNAIIENNDFPQGSTILYALQTLIKQRKAEPVEGSYTNYLLDRGVDKICKKVGEEAAEVIIGAKNNSSDELRYEAADLLYHLMVLLVNQGLAIEDVFAELAKRHQPKP